MYLYIYTCISFVFSPSWQGIGVLTLGQVSLRWSMCDDQAPSITFHTYHIQRRKNNAYIRIYIYTHTLESVYIYTIHNLYMSYMWCVFFPPLLWKRFDLGVLPRLQRFLDRAGQVFWPTQQHQQRLVETVCGDQADDYPGRIWLEYWWCLWGLTG